MLFWRFRKSAEEFENTVRREPLLGEGVRERLHAFLGGIARDNGMVALTVGGVADHVHMLVSLPRTTSIAKAVQLLKAALPNG